MARRCSVAWRRLPFIQALADDKPGPLTNAHRAKVSRVALLMARERARVI
jgi:hypothetical protein